MTTYQSDKEFYAITSTKFKGANKFGWMNSYWQSKRYHVLTKDLNLSDKKCLLLGCGEGAGTPFLHASGCKNVVGADLMPEFIEEAKKRYPEHEWHLVSGTKDAFHKIGPVDWVVMNGTFNVKTVDNNYQKLKTVIAQNIKEGIAISCAIHNEDPDVVNWNPVEVINILSVYFESYKIDTSYHPKDFCAWGFKKLTPNF